MNLIKKRAPQKRNTVFKYIFYALILVQIGVAGITSKPTQKKRSSKADCLKLHKHQLKVFTSDVKNPLLRSMNINRAGMNQKKSVQKEIRYCMKNIGLAEFTCRMRATNIASLLQCKNPPASTNKISNRIVTDTTNKTTHIQSNFVKVNTKNCKHAYRHMLSILKRSPSLKQNKKNKELLQYWTSEDEIQEFHLRCKKVFSPDDLGCILGSKNSDVLQACLILIERE